MRAKSLFRTPVAVRPVAAAFGIVALLGVIPANAADMIEATPEPTPIEELPVASWVGPYVGVQLGYGFGNTDVGAVEVDPDGVIGSAFAGFNGQTGNLVYGVEGEVGYSGVEGSGAGVDVKSGVEGSIRARLGYAPSDTILVYGTAGGAAKDLEVSAGGASDSKGLLGYTVGAGTEIKFTQNMFGRVEYRYSDYGSETFDVGGGTDVDSQDHRVTFGVGLSF
jgi:outer membrane immunogenic protein